MLQRPATTRFSRTLENVTVALFVGAALSCQTYSTSPRGYLSTEADDYARFGQFSNGRAMHFDGEMRGLPMVVQQVSLRRDSTSSFGGMGRRWPSVSLRIADCDYARITTVFGWGSGCREYRQRCCWQG